MKQETSHIESEAYIPLQLNLENAKSSLDVEGPVINFFFLLHDHTEKKGGAKTAPVRSLAELGLAQIKKQMEAICFDWIGFIHRSYRSFGSVKRLLQPG